MIVDVRFSLSGRGDPLPADHAYAVYSAVSRLLPNVHEKANLGVHPIAGIQTGDRRMLLKPTSALTIRIESEQIAEILPLAGKTLGLGGAFLQIGVPSVFVLQPSPGLRSRLVNIKGLTEPDAFIVGVRRQLDKLNVSQSAEIILRKRRTLQIHEANVVGYEVLLNGLSDEESIRVQEIGIGGRRKMGCGIFTPFVVNPSSEKEPFNGENNG